MTTNQKRILERLERDVSAAVSAFETDPIWFQFDPTVASNVGHIQVGRESSVATLASVHVDFQATNVTFKVVNHQPRFWRGDHMRDTIRLDNTLPHAQQTEAYDAVVRYLVDGLSEGRS